MTMQRPLFKKIEFAGQDGMLAARLDLPAGKPHAYALFAHCFTCSKDILAARSIARTLADLGIAVLRFDFTGLGGSEGDFANTNFSSNVADLVAAADYMRDHLEAPALLIGHSLGGAAVIAAASQVPEAKAVVTIAAPSAPAHLLKALGGSLEEISQTGQAEVLLGERPFTIKSQLLEDISRASLTEALKGLGKALLVLHAPADQIVGIDNATEIFVAARHPKSFVSLDDADHLLSDRKAAAYAAEVVAAWASKYLPGSADNEAEDGVPEGVVRVTEADPDGFLQTISAGSKFHLIADEPPSAGGTDLGPSPYQLLSAALGACTSMTMRMYARRKKWSIDTLSVDVSHAKSYAADFRPDETDNKNAKIDVFTRAILLEGALDADQRARLLEIADKCPVHKTLTASAHIETRYSQSSD